jgi:glycosyltransferase involved in cell wall biosynthesis
MGIPEQDEIVNASGGGVLVPFDATSISDAILSLLEQPELRLKAGRAGRAYIETHRDYAIYARRLFDLLVQVKNVQDRK